MTAAKNGFVENKNQIATVTIFSTRAEGLLLEELSTLMKKRKMINTIKEIRMEA